MVRLILALLLMTLCARAQAAVPEATLVPDELEPPPPPSPEPSPAPSAGSKNVIAVAPPVPRPEPKEISDWYGWQTLSVDAASLLLVIAGSEVGESAFTRLGTGGLLIGAPIVHWAHGEVGRGFGSLGLRFATAGVIVLGLIEIVDDHEGDSDVGWFYVGTALAILTPFIDGFALAWTKKAEPPAQPRASAAASVQVVVGPTRALDGAILGLAGRL